MEYRTLGRSGFKVPELCFGTGTFGAGNEFFAAWGDTQTRRSPPAHRHLHGSRLQLLRHRRRLLRRQERRGPRQAIKHLKREDVLISTKATFRFGPGANNVGCSRYHLIDQLSRLPQAPAAPTTSTSTTCTPSTRTTPVEETLDTLDKFVREGKVRYIACSNFSGWHLMKSLCVSERYGWSRYVGHQVYYSLIGRDYEWELMPLALDQGVGALVWSPLGWGRLTGKIRRGQPLPETSRLQQQAGRRRRPQCPTGSTSTKSSTRSTKSPRRPASPSRRFPSTGCCAAPPSPHSSSARATKSNSAPTSPAVDWKLTPEQVAKLDAASADKLAYPYWHQIQFNERNPFPVPQTLITEA